MWVIDPLTISVEYSYLNTSIANAGGCLENVADPLAEQAGAELPGHVQAVVANCLQKDREGRYPTHKDGLIPGSGGETWCAVNLALMRGTRGLPGGISLTRLLARHGLISR